MDSSIHYTTRGVVRTGNTACCNVNVSVIHVIQTVLRSRGDILAMSIHLHNRCNNGGSIFVNGPYVMDTGNTGHVLRLGLARRRLRGLSGSYAVLGSGFGGLGVRGWQQTTIPHS